MDTQCSRTTNFLPLFVHFVVICVAVVSARNLQLMECPPPNYPQFGGYGPRKEAYVPGDMVNYYCDDDTFMSGNYLRMCQDNGDWTDETPFCDVAATFDSMEQSSTAQPLYQNDAGSASDGDRRTCSSTREKPYSSWTGKFNADHYILRVILFFPISDVNYEVMVIKNDGTEHSCGNNNKRIERYEWIHHNCPHPNNSGIRAIRIQSLNDSPLEICEIFVHGFTDPACLDPQQYVENGRLVLSRRSATLVCDKGFVRSRDYKLSCIRTGVWTRKNLQCFDLYGEVTDVDESAGAVDSDKGELNINHSESQHSNNQPSEEAAHSQDERERETMMY